MAYVAIGLLILLALYTWSEGKASADTHRLQLGMIKDLEIEIRQVRATHGMQIEDLRADLLDHWHGDDRDDALQVVEEALRNAPIANGLPVRPAAEYVLNSIRAARFPVRGPTGPTGPNR